MKNKITTEFHDWFGEYCKKDNKNNMKITPTQFSDIIMKVKALENGRGTR